MPYYPELFWWNMQISTEMCDLTRQVVPCFTSCKWRQMIEGWKWNEIWQNNVTCRWQEHWTPLIDAYHTRIYIFWKEDGGGVVKPIMSTFVRHSVREWGCSLKICQKNPFSPGVTFSYQKKKTRGGKQPRNPPLNPPMLHWMSHSLLYWIYNFFMLMN